MASYVGVIGRGRKAARIDAALTGLLAVVLAAVLVLYVDGELIFDWALCGALCVQGAVQMMDQHRARRAGLLPWWGESRWSRSRAGGVALGSNAQWAVVTAVSVGALSGLLVMIGRWGRGSMAPFFVGVAGFGLLVCIGRGVAAIHPRWSRRVRGGAKSAGGMRYRHPWRTALMAAVFAGVAGYVIARPPMRPGWGQQWRGFVALMLCVAGFLVLEALCAWRELRAGQPRMQRVRPGGRSVVSQAAIGVVAFGMGFVCGVVFSGPDLRTLATTPTAFWIGAAMTVAGYVVMCVERWRAAGRGV